MSAKVILPYRTFQTVVEHTPLVSIDLVVKDPQGRVLLGKRTNRPAQGSWFVPGGRITKDETFEQAYVRLLELELACSPDEVDRKFLGVYQHFYDDNFSDDDFSTHYVVLAYELCLKQPLLQLPADQHSDYCWLSVDEVLASSDVHVHSQWYFKENTQADAVT